MEILAPMPRRSTGIGPIRRIRSHASGVPRSSRGCSRCSRSGMGFPRHPGHQLRSPHSSAACCRCHSASLNPTRKPISDLPPA